MKSCIIHNEYEEKIYRFIEDDWPSPLCRGHPRSPPPVLHSPWTHHPAPAASCTPGPIVFSPITSRYLVVLPREYLEFDTRWRIFKVFRKPRDLFLYALYTAGKSLDHEVTSHLVVSNPALYLVVFQKARSFTQGPKLPTPDQVCITVAPMFIHIPIQFS